MSNWFVVIRGGSILYLGTDGGEAGTTYAVAENSELFKIQTLQELSDLLKGQEKTCKSQEVPFVSEPAWQFGQSCCGGGKCGSQEEKKELSPDELLGLVNEGIDAINAFSLNTLSVLGVPKQSVEKFKKDTQEKKENIAAYIRKGGTHTAQKVKTLMARTTQQLSRFVEKLSDEK